MTTEHDPILLRARRKEEPFFDATWVPDEVPQIWVNALWERFGTFTLARTHDGLAMRVEPGHRRVMTGMALTSATLLVVGVTVAVLLWWGPEGVIGEAGWLSYVVVLSMGGGAFLAFVTAWEWVALVVNGSPGAGLVLLFDPRAQQTAKDAATAKGAVKRRAGLRALRQQRRALRRASRPSSDRPAADDDTCDAPGCSLPPAVAGWKGSEPITAYCPEHSKEVTQ